MKRALPALVGLLLLTGCGSDRDNNISQLYKLLRKATTDGLKSKVTIQEAAAIPYASMGWALNGGSQNIIVLATDSGGQQLWTSAAHVVLQTQDGHITRTVGLPHDLAGLVPQNSQALSSPARALNGPFSERRIADFPDIGGYNMVLDCRVGRVGPQTIAILGKRIRTMKVAERCTAPRWTFTNDYWISMEDGMVWRTRQNIHPSGDVLDTEILRPPG